MTATTSTPTPAPIPSNLPRARQRIYTKDQLSVCDLLDFPVWVFDIVNKAMWWANEPACYLWDAPDCESLCNRDFATGMSQSTDQSMLAWLEAFREGKTKNLTWTFHPNQGKTGPKTCELLTSGIYVSKTGKPEDRHMCMLVVIKQIIETARNNKAEETKIRRTEMLRHFPIVARQFNFEGKLMDQNPQAHVTFGSPDDAEPSETILPKGHLHRDKSRKLRRMTEIVRPEAMPSKRSLFDTIHKQNNDTPNDASTLDRQQQQQQPQDSSSGAPTITKTNNSLPPVSETGDPEQEPSKEPDQKILQNGSSSSKDPSSSLSLSSHQNSKKTIPDDTPSPQKIPEKTKNGTSKPSIHDKGNPTTRKTTTTTTSEEQNDPAAGQEQEPRSDEKVMISKPAIPATNGDSGNSETIPDSSSSSPLQRIVNVKGSCDFLAQFVDVEAGKEALREISAGRDYSTETQQITLEGPKWFTVNVRRIQDPVTSEPVIIYSGRDITKVMESAKLEADKQNMKRNEFFAVMAHEIRTPLHQVVGFIELLATSGLNAEQTESVDMLQSSAHALMAIINDLLDFTKLEAGKMKLEIIPFEVRGVLDGSVAAVQPQVHEKGLVVKCNVDQNIPIKLLGDPNRLRQIVLNMLSNAVKFTKTGEIIVESHRIKKENGQMTVRFSVKDSGIGIPKDKCDRIFNPYQQADASVSRNFGGTGLGLAICKSLCENMGGSIGVDSELGKGATFWFEIPFGIFMKGHHQEATDHDTRSKDDLVNLRILVAEDNKVNQKVVCKMLSRLGHETVVVQNGQEAVTAITENEGSAYDIILMDWQMPVMDGIDATKEIRRKGFNMSTLPIVGLTASIQGLDWYAIGMNDCLKKPIRIADLKSALAKNME